MPPARVINKGSVYHGALRQIKQREKCVGACSSVTHYITVIECMQAEQGEMLSGHTACTADVYAVQ